jgi:hypothetical protein
MLQSAPGCYNARALGGMELKSPQWTVDQLAGMHGAGLELV